MSNATPTRLGQANGSGSVDALFRDIYTGEVLSAFNAKNVTMDKHSVRNIANGNAATFYATGTVSGGYHQVGSEVLGGPTFQNKLTITTDDTLYSSAFIADIDELKNSYEVRSEITKQQGEFLANAFDKNVLRTGVLAARSPSPVTGQPGGATITAANIDTDASAFVKAVFAARVSMEERNIDWKSDTFLYVRPAMYSLLAQNKDLLNKDWGGEGSYAQGAFQMIAGIPIISTTNLPSANLSNDAAITAAGEDPALILAKYRGDFSKTVGLIMNKDAVGTVKLRDMLVESNYDPRRFGTLITSRFILGHGVRRSAGAVELAKA